MPEYLIELLFWVAIFVGLFFVLRRLQSRKSQNEAPKDTHKDDT